MKWLRSLLFQKAYLDGFEDGVNQGWQDAARANYERAERRRTHSTDACPICKERQA